MLANSSRWWSLKDALLGQPNKSSGNSVLVVKGTVHVTLLVGGHREKSSGGHRWDAGAALEDYPSVVVRCLIVWNLTVKGTLGRQ